jgi:hypothetical protein
MARGLFSRVRGDVFVLAPEIGRVSDLIHLRIHLTATQSWL